jgi:hypothetical protein
MEMVVVNRVFVVKLLSCEIKLDFIIVLKVVSEVLALQVEDVLIPLDFV